MYIVKLKRWLGESNGGSVAADTLAWPVDGGREAAQRVALEIEHEVTRLFEELRTPLLRYLLSLGLSPADGEEVVQETFMALYRHLRLGRPRSNLRGWVFRTGHNLGLKSRQRAGRRRASNGDEALIADVPDRRPNAEDVLAARQRMAKIEAVKGALPERDRYCLSLRAEGLTYREIAETLGISLGAVSIAITRSLTRLREAAR